MNPYPGRNSPGPLVQLVILVIALDILSQLLGRLLPIIAVTLVLLCIFALIVGRWRR